MPVKTKRKAGGKKGSNRIAQKNDLWHLYILECGDGSLYTGISNNVQRRLLHHQTGRGARYTRSHLPVRLVYTEECGARQIAMKRELQVKQYSRLKKRALIAL